MSLNDRVKQDMESGLEHVVRVVQTRFADIRQNRLSPFLQSTRRFADRRPITAILISIFSLLSFLPVASFIGFAILVIAAFVFVGLGCAFIASTILIVAAGGVLIFILGTLLLASIFLTGAVVTLVITFQLMQHLTFRSDLKQGLLGWADEVRRRFGWPIAEANRPLVKNEVDVKKDASGSDEWHPVSGSDGQT